MIISKRQYMLIGIALPIGDAKCKRCDEAMAYNAIMEKFARWELDHSNHPIISMKLHAHRTANLLIMLLMSQLFYFVVTVACGVYNLIVLK